MAGLRNGDRCLNCGAELHGPFCAVCGQRFVPADPTVAELAGDAWHELSGYDGRIASTIRGLLHPGRLTVEYLSGRRATYLPPVRVYSIVSVLYFVVAAGAPNLDPQTANGVTGPGGIKVTLGTDNPILSEQDRAELLKELDTAPWYLRPTLRAVAEDPEKFRARMFSIMPRMFFGLLPVFAAIVALFYRGRTFPTSLVFAVHVHAFAFVLFTLSEASKYSRVTYVAVAMGLTAVVGSAVYVVLALRAVFGGSWPATVLKAAGIGVVYLIAYMPAILIILYWASLT